MSSVRLSLLARFDALRRRLHAFRSDRRGNVLIMFGFALVPMIGLVGAAVDYSRASTARQMLNAAVDSAALMAARDAAKLTDSQLRTRIDQWIRANLNGDAADTFGGATITIDRTARTVDIAANLDVKTTLIRVLGQDKVAVNSSSQSAWGTNQIELALVLDNTGSMASSGKMTALKAASLDLINIMKDAATEPDQIKISIVPFSTRVLLETSNKNASWLRWNQTQTTCSNWWPYNCTTTTISKTSWQGCVADRDQPYDVSDGDGGGTNATTYPADFCDQYSPSTQAKILPLTSDWTALTNRVNAMTPVGATNVTIGAVWGMATLSSAMPFMEAQATGTARLKKYMILLTDGQNTKNRFEGNGSTANANIDARTALACENIKAAGVQIYTIRVIDGNAALLRDCASSSNMYYDVQSASQLSPVFQAIAREISQVRLTM